MKKSLASLSYLFLLCCLYLPRSFAQAVDEDQQPFDEPIALSTDVVWPHRFVAVHGRKAAIMGYPGQGLEIWGYPFQILDHYQVGFRPAGAATESDGVLLLRRLIYRPDSITRIYIGPDYIVREKLFVPLDRAAAILSYEVEGQRAVDIGIHFQPALNLMWPGAIGGQTTAWRAEIPGYLISEATHRVSAVIASEEIAAHDETTNSTLSGGGLSLFLRPKAVPGVPAVATLYAAFETAAQDPVAEIRALSLHRADLETQAAAHYAELERSALQIHTPDERVNSALTWAEVALDQAWVCNPQLGCAIVAGYGPSRDARRPQYDWFFAGDGLIAVDALLSAGEYSRAREELAFIRKYQDPVTGMIWHELAQSAGYLDWSKYPYMFVHVDISFAYLSTLARYVSVTGDTSFATQDWPSVAAVYRYCHSLVSTNDHLPHIPTNKEGGDEQDRPRDDLALSVSWLEASNGFARLARLTGRSQQAWEADQAAALTRQAIKSSYWDAKDHFWIGAHTDSGTPVIDYRSRPANAILQNVFSPQQNGEIMNRLASSAFESDWGVRGVAAGSGIFAPASYSKGSVSALGTAEIAGMFWQEHRPTEAFAAWSAILPWNVLDSPGHIHEVLAGDFYHEQMESVPEQTWSSAGFLDAAVRGLLGLNIEAAGNRLHFAPHIPAQWDQISVDNIHLPRSNLSLTVHQARGEIGLEIHNEGSSAQILFAPQIPLGARLTVAECQSHPVSSKLLQYDEETQAAMEIEAPPGLSRCALRFVGGLSLILNQVAPQFGDASTGMKITALSLRNRTLSIDADVNTDGNNTFRVQTSWKAVAVKGAALRSLSGASHEVSFQRPTAPRDLLGYAPVHAEIVFSDR